MTNHRPRLLLVALAALFAMLFELTYEYVLVPLYSYQGLIYVTPEPEHIWAARFACVLPAAWLPTALKRPSQVAYWIIYLFVIVPLCFVPVLARAVDVDDYQYFVVTVIASYAVIGISYLVPLGRIHRVQIPPQWFWTATMAISAVFFGIIFHTFGFRFELVDLDAVYDVRADFKAALARGGGIVPYVVVWQANVMDALLMSSGLVERKPLFIALGVIGQVAIFSITGFKSVLFSGIVFLGLLVAMRRDGRTFGQLAVGGAGSALAFILIADRLDASLPTLTGMLHRMISLPGLLTGFYFDFFSHHRHAYLGSSVLSSVVDYKYTYDIPNLIGDVYFHNPNTSANANFFADAFANFGYSGVVVFALILGMIFWVYDSLTQTAALKLTGLMMAIPALSLANSGLLTCLMSHGIGLVVVLVALMPSEELHQQPTKVAAPMDPAAVRGTA